MGKKYTEASYAAYLRTQRKKIPSSRIGRLKQAHEVCVRLVDREPKGEQGRRWRHKYFISDKHSMSDFLDMEHLKEEEKDQEPMEQEEEEAAVDNNANGDHHTETSSDAESKNGEAVPAIKEEAEEFKEEKPPAGEEPAPTSSVDGPATPDTSIDESNSESTSPVKKPKLENGNTEKEVTGNPESSGDPENSGDPTAAAAAAKVPENHEDEEFDESTCEEDVNDVLNEMGANLTKK